MIATLVLITAIVAAVATNSTNIRFVHRHACAGLSQSTAVDEIGCAEPHLVPFSHTLTPARLWCNTERCWSEFNDTYTVHSIDCDDSRCSVEVHCDERVEPIIVAAASTLVGAIVLVALPRLLPDVDEDDRRKKML